MSGVGYDEVLLCRYCSLGPTFQVLCANALWCETTPPPSLWAHGIWGALQTPHSTCL